VDLYGLGVLIVRRVVADKTPMVHFLHLAEPFARCADPPRCCAAVSLSIVLNIIGQMGSVSDDAYDLLHCSDSDQRL
jgi:hypothetical protein